MGISGGGGGGSGSGGAAAATDTIYDAKGDLAVGTGADTAAKVPVGSDNQILAADSSQTAGVAWKDLVTVSGGSGVAPVKVATNAVLSGTPAYLNGTAGVGATLISVSFGALSVDGVTVAVGDRILVKNQASGLQNGIYVVTATGGGAAFYTLTRSVDFDQAVDVFEGTFTLVSEGTVNAQTAWQMTTQGAITMGTTALVFAELTDAATVSYPWYVQGLLGWTGDPEANASVNRTPAAATIYLRKMMVPKTQTFTTLWVFNTTAGTNYTNAQLGLYSSAGTYLSASAVQASAGTNGFNQTNAGVGLNLAAAQTVTGGPNVFVWLAIHFGTNAATSALFGGHGGLLGLMNLGCTAATARIGTYTGHATNDLATIGNLTPASISITPTAAADIWGAAS